MEKCYHNKCDEVSRITNDRLQFMGKISEALCRSLDMFSGKGPTSGVTGVSIKGIFPSINPIHIYFFVVFHIYIFFLF